MRVVYHGVRFLSNLFHTEVAELQILEVAIRVVYHGVRFLSNLFHTEVAELQSVR